jgi:glycolate oxidase iron-sulfur subunit
MQKLKLDRLINTLGLTKLLPLRLQRMQAQLPQLRDAVPELPEYLPAKGQRRARVALFTGCVADAMFRHVHWATARVLQENGCDVVVPRQQACCGAIHYHNGAAQPAINLMQQNMAAFQDPSIDAVIVNVAGCGSMLKDYAHISEELNGHATEGTENNNTSAQTFSSRIRDVHEFLDALGPVPPKGRIEASVAYQDACHLQHAQRIRQQPRDLLKLIPGIQLKSINEPELCCGAAGSYNLTQPEMADRLGRRKLSCIMETNPEIIASGNAGCSMQLQAHLQQLGLAIPVLHPMELLDLSYQQKPLSSLR